MVSYYDIKKESFSSWETVLLRNPFKKIDDDIKKTYLVNKQLTTYSSVRDHLNATFHCNTPKLEKGTFKEASLKKIDDIKKEYFEKKTDDNIFPREGSF